MTPLAIRLSAIIALHRGRSAAISRRRLVELIAPTEPQWSRVTVDRRIREAVAALIEQGMMIASVQGEGGGYFTPVTDQEYAEAIRPLEHRAWKLLKRVAALKQQTPVAVAESMQQQEMAYDTISH